MSYILPRVRLAANMMSHWCSLHCCRHPSMSGSLVGSPKVIMPTLWPSNPQITKDVISSLFSGRIMYASFANNFFIRVSSVDVLPKLLAPLRIISLFIILFHAPRSSPRWLFDWFTKGKRRNLYRLPSYNWRLLALPINSRTATKKPYACICNQCLRQYSSRNTMPVAR